MNKRGICTLHRKTDKSIKNTSRKKTIHTICKRAVLIVLTTVLLLSNAISALAITRVTSSNTSSSDVTKAYSDVDAMGITFLSAVDPTFYTTNSSDFKFYSSKTMYYDITEDGTGYSRTCYNAVLVRIKSYSSSNPVSVSGYYTLTYDSAAYDAKGNLLDIVVKVSDVKTAVSSNNTGSTWMVSSRGYSNALILGSAETDDEIWYGHNATRNIHQTITIKFYKHGTTSYAESGNLIMRAAHINSGAGTSSYTGSITLGSAFTKVWTSGSNKLVVSNSNKTYSYDNGSYTANTTTGNESGYRYTIYAKASATASISFTHIRNVEIFGNYSRPTVTVTKNSSSGGNVKLTSGHLYNYYTKNDKSTTVRSSSATGAKTLTTSWKHNMELTTTASTGYHISTYKVNGTTKSSAIGESSYETTFSGITSDKTLVVSFSVNTYTIKYNANGGSGTVSSQTNIKYGDSVTLRTNKFTRTGYTFVEWNTKKDGSGTSYTAGKSYKNLTSTNGGTVTLYAIWETNTYYIKFYKNTGSGSMSTMTCTYGKTYTLTANSYTKSGCVFSGWNTAADGLGTSYSNKAKVKNLTSKNGGTVKLYAQWTEVKYTLIYNANGGSGSNKTYTITYGDGTTAINNPFSYSTSSATYAFVSWNTKASGKGTSYDPGDNVSKLTSSNGGTVTLYAIWEKDTTYYIKYYTNYPSDAGLSATTQKTAESTDESVTLLEISELGWSCDGYTFAGWRTDLGTNSNGSSAKHATDASYDDVVYKDGYTGSALTSTAGTTVNLYAVWVANTYIVTFYENAKDATGSDQQTQEIRFGTSTALTTISALGISRTGYTFAGWAEEEDATVAVYADGESVLDLGEAAGDYVSLYAVWSPVSYTISYDPNGGTETETMATTTQLYDEEITIATSTYESVSIMFVQNGWNTAADGSGYQVAEGESITNPNAQLGVTNSNTSITLYAQWELKTWLYHYITTANIYDLDNGVYQVENYSTGTTTIYTLYDTDGDGTGDYTLTETNGVFYKTNGSEYSWDADSDDILTPEEAFPSSYISQDSSNGTIKGGYWIKQDDDTWEYMFYVESTDWIYYTFEETTSSGTLMKLSDFIGDYTVYNPYTIYDPEAEEAVITNSDTDVTSLTLTKSVVDEDGGDYASDDTFSFTITLGAGDSGADLSGDVVFGDYVFTDGVCYVTLGDDETITIEELYVGMTYKIQETLSSGQDYTATYYINGTACSTNYASGTLEDTDEVTVSVINSGINDYGSLSITKIVLDENGDETDEYDDERFHVVVTLTDENKNALEGTTSYGGYIFTDGVYEFYIQNGQTVLIKNIPTGYHYYVEETDLEDGWTVEYEGQTDEITTASCNYVAIVNSTDGFGKLEVYKQVLEEDEATGKTTDITDKNTFNVVVLFFDEDGKLLTEAPSYSTAATLESAGGYYYYFCDLADDDYTYTQGIEFTNIPAGYQYLVLEIDTSALTIDGDITEPSLNTYIQLVGAYGYAPSEAAKFAVTWSNETGIFAVGKYTTTYTNQTGTIQKYDEDAEDPVVSICEVTNVYVVPPVYGQLTIEKKIDGRYTSDDTEYQFTVELTDMNPGTIYYVNYYSLVMDNDTDSLASITESTSHTTSAGKTVSDIMDDYDASVFEGTEELYYVTDADNNYVTYNGAYVYYAAGSDDTAYYFYSITAGTADYALVAAEELEAFISARENAGTVATTEANATVADITGDYDSDVFKGTETLYYVTDSSGDYITYNDLFVYWATGSDGTTYYFYSVAADTADYALATADEFKTLFSTWKNSTTAATTAMTIEDITNNYDSDVFEGTETLYYVTDTSGNYITYNGWYIYYATGSNDKIYYFYYVYETQENYTTDANGEATVSVSLTADERAVFGELPENTTYRVTEASGGYTSAYTLTDANGISNFVSTSGFAKDGSSLQTATETVDGKDTDSDGYSDYAEDVTVTFTNTLSKYLDITVKKVSLDYSGSEDTDDDTEYVITATFTNLDAETEYAYSDGNGTIEYFYSDSDGAGQVTLYLTNGKIYTFEDIPVGAEYWFEESAENEKIASYTVVDQNGGDNITSASGKNTENYTPLQTGIEKVDENEYILVTFTNTSCSARVRLRKEDSSGNALAGAVFALYKVVGSCDLDAPDDQQEDILINDNLVTSSEDDDFGYTEVVEGLLPGDYYFVELVAADGYTVTQTYVSFTITVDDIDTLITIVAKDNTLLILASTGGTGIMTIIAISLAIAAATFIAAEKKKRAKRIIKGV